MLLHPEGVERVQPREPRPTVARPEGGGRLNAATTQVKRVRISRPFRANHLFGWFPGLKPWEALPEPRSTPRKLSSWSCRASQLSEMGLFLLRIVRRLKFCFHHGIRDYGLVLWYRRNLPLAPCSFPPNRLHCSNLWCRFSAPSRYGCAHKPLHLRVAPQHSRQPLFRSYQ